ncbi:MAG TPA: hypothetical protein VFI73_04420 [Candidatus Nitrosopolaris sp.]|nr:hypothetical protein [Candidatus Nitrosopolaris sp.]
MNTIKILQIWLAIGLIGILIYIYSSSIVSPVKMTRYRQLCIGQSHNQLQLELQRQCTSLDISVLIAIFGPDTGIIAALLGFYIALMAEVNMIFEKKNNRIR